MYCMNLPLLLVTVMVTGAIQTQGYTRTDRRVSKIDKRQATNADQMVQNILQWLQGVYSQNSRRVRQGTLREYLPPANTERPRPFQPGYPPAGFSPEPPFQLPINPVTGGVTAPEGYVPIDNDDVLIPPDLGSGGGPKVPETQPEVTGGPSTLQPGGPTGVPEVQTGQPPSDTNGQPGVTTGEAGYTPGQPGYTYSQPESPTGEAGPVSEQPALPTGAPTLPAEEQPGPFPTHPESVPESGPSITTTLSTGYPDAGPGAPFTSQPGSPVGPEGTQPSVPPYTSPAGTPSDESTPGQAVQTSTTLQAEVVPDIITTPAPVNPEETPAPISPSGGEAPGTVDTNEPVSPEQPESPKETIPEELPPVPVIPGEPAPGSTLPPADTPAPSGFTTSTPTPLSESQPQSTTTEAESLTTTAANPETNTIPETGKQSPGVNEEDLKHPPHIHAIDVQCGKEMMTINIEFNREFNGVIYSKGFYNNPDCRYVQENSGSTKYTFTVSLDKCGTEFVNAFDTQNQSYLENVLVLQNELGIQEVWDTVRSVRCLWEGNIKDTLSVAFSIGMLSQEIITFSGDTAMAKLDVLLGRGHLGAPANGLVKIGEEMTLVVSVSGDPGFDLQVKDCKAVDTAGKNTVALTDEDGCILKPKLFGAFQKTRETGNTGASIIAYAYFNAFKFPDEMDLMIECNIELCKNDCDICSKDGQQVIPAKRRRRDVGMDNATVIGDWVTMGKLVRVILPEDLNENTALEVTSKNHICMSIEGFVFSTALLVTLLVVTSFISVALWLRKKEKMYLKY